MSTWTHRGVEITLLPNATFRASINGKPAVSKSLEGVKKRIDEAIDDPNRFKPFAGFYVQGDEVYPCEVLGQKTGGRGIRRNRTVWSIKFDRRGESEAMLVVRSTPEVVKLVEEHQALKHQNDAERERMEAAERVLIEKIESFEEAPK